MLILFSPVVLNQSSAFAELAPGKGIPGCFIGIITVPELDRYRRSRQDPGVFFLQDFLLVSCLYFWFLKLYKRQQSRETKNT